MNPCLGLGGKEEKSATALELAGSCRLGHMVVQGSSQAKEKHNSCNTAWVLSGCLMEHFYVSPDGSHGNC